MRRYWLVFGVVAMVLGSGCQATGMGFVLSTDGIHKATFGFVFDGFTSTFSGSYHDPNGTVPLVVGTTVDVAMKGTGVVRVAPPGQTPDPLPCTGTVLGGPTTYEAQNPNTLPPELAALGTSGTLNLYLCDFDKGGTADPGDTLLIDVTSGPYTGYHNERPVLGGNITVK